MTQRLPTTERLRDAAATVNKYGHAGPRKTAMPSQADRLLAAVLALVGRATSIDTDRDGYPASTAGGERTGNDSATLNSVESAADANLYGKPIRDEVAEHAESAATHFTESARHLRAAQYAVDCAEAAARSASKAASTEPPCKQLHCADIGSTRFGGNCEPCYRYLYRRPDCRAVPAEVIAERETLRRTGKRSAPNPDDLADAG